MPKLGIIGGSGLYSIPGFVKLKEECVSTPYGDPSGSYLIAGPEDGSGPHVVFLPRHGAAHSIPPHKVNYRANIWGMQSLGVERIIGVTAVGGIDPALSPGSILLPDQVMDFTQGARESTFYEGGDVVHIDFTDPYCPEMRAVLIKAAQIEGLACTPEATYVCTNGPRLESRAEIEFFRRAGGHIVGMTGMPETALARELQVCYAAVSVVTNFAAGVSAAGKLTTTEVVETMAKSTGAVMALLKTSFSLMPQHRGCPCKDALSGTRL